MFQGFGGPRPQTPILDDAWTDFVSNAQNATGEWANVTQVGSYTYIVATYRLADYIIEWFANNFAVNHAHHVAIWQQWIVTQCFKWMKKTVKLWRDYQLFGPEYLTRYLT